MQHSPFCNIVSNFIPVLENIHVYNSMQTGGDEQRQGSTKNVSENYCSDVFYRYNLELFIHFDDQSSPETNQRR